MRKWNAEKGMSLVEATIILMVLAILTAVIAPSAGDYVSEARNIKAKEDVESIGTGLMRMLRDTGSRCVRYNGAVDCTKANRVDLLVSAGNDPNTVTATEYTYADGDEVISSIDNWIPGATAPSGDNRGTIEDHLIENDSAGGAYTDVSFTAGGGPRMNLGWRGAYLNGPTGGDPWGYKYQVNTVFLGVATDATDVGAIVLDTAEGMRGSGWKKDVLVISAGANGSVDTPWASAAVGTSAVADDVIYVVKGSTR